MQGESWMGERETGREREREREEEEEQGRISVRKMRHRGGDVRHMYQVILIINITRIAIFEA